jgi:alanine racemase
MHRLGFDPHHVPQLLEELARWPEVVVASALTHLASADQPDQDDFTRRQLASFQAAADALSRGLGYPVWRHALNSAGAARFPEAAGDLVRLGLGLYGYSSVPSERSWLRPVAGLFSVVSQVRTVPTGDSVSYGGTWVAPEPREIATIPVGYADGFARSLSNGVGHVCIRGRRVPVVGVVCMDMFMVDVTGLGCQKGDRVEWFGPTQSLYEVASEMQTIPYEVLTGLSPRIKRLYVRADH